MISDEETDILSCLVSEMQSTYISKSINKRFMICIVSFS
jgi:hypothetical protein